MDKTIADRLADLRSDRGTSLPTVPMTGLENRAQRAQMPGFDGRLAHMSAISRKRGVTPFEASCSPLEHLLFTGKLLRQGEPKEIGEARVEAAYAYRDDMQKAEIAGLGAQVISDAMGGGGNRATLSEHKLFAMQSLGELKHCMGHQEYLLLERVVWKDEWVFMIPEPKGKTKSRAHHKARRIAMEKRRANALDEIRMVLDLAAVHYGLTMMGVVRERWSRPKRSSAGAGAALGPGGIRKSPRHTPATTAAAQPSPQTSPVAQSG